MCGYRHWVGSEVMACLQQKQKNKKKHNKAKQWLTFQDWAFVRANPGWWWGGTPIYGLYGDVPLNRVWFLPLRVWNSVYKSAFLVWNRVYFLPFRLWNMVGVTILLPESRYKRTLLLFPLGSRCTFTQTLRFRLEGQLRLTFFSLEQGIFFTILSGTG